MTAPLVSSLGLAIIKGLARRCAEQSAVGWTTDASFLICQQEASLDTENLADIAEDYYRRKYTLQVIHTPDCMTDLAAVVQLFVQLGKCLCPVAPVVTIKST